MFSELDNTIFPDSCEVLEIVPSQLFVYPIFKNGSSSLRTTTNCKKIYNQDIQQIQHPITVFLRDPRERFISGVNTFVQHCIRDNPKLDTQTILYFVKHYLFLDRHYAPQFFWLINLSKFSTVPLILRDRSDISQLTNKNYSTVEKVDSKFTELLADFPWDKLELYFFLDQILIERIGQTLTFDDIIKIVQQRPDLYNLIFKHTQDTVNVLSKT
jgi:hypothetical protein